MRMTTGVPSHGGMTLDSIMITRIPRVPGYRTSPARRPAANGSKLRIIMILFCHYLGPPARIPPKMIWCRCLRRGGGHAVPG
eukprot:1429317-Rhodomonas_salina.1